MNITIRHVPRRHCFDTKVSNQRCYLNYKVVDKNTLSFYETYVPENIRGQGIAGRLVEYALNYARNNQLKVIPDCTYVKKYFYLHPEFNDVLA